jgi:hypothetical protein
MFSRASSFSTAVTDIQTLLGDASTGAADLDDSTRAWLLQTRQAITAQKRPTGRGRPWWPRRPQRQHRRRLVISCVAVPALLAVSAAGWVIATSPPASRVAGNVLCYSGRYLPGPELDQSGSTLLTMSDGAPIAECARQWARGAVIGDAHDHYVPPLVACVLPPGPLAGVGTGGGVGVFPDTTCAALHLSPLPPGYTRAARRVFALNSYLQAGMIGTASRPRCLAVPAADAYVRQALRKYGFTGWRITHPWGVVQPFSGTHAGCWEGQSDSAAHTIQVLPIP